LPICVKLICCNDAGCAEIDLADDRLALNRHAFSSNGHAALACCWSMIPRVEPEGMVFENRHPPWIKSGAGFFGIML
jgi:hypothetical protein